MHCEVTSPGVVLSAPPGEYASFRSSSTAPSNLPRRPPTSDVSRTRRTLRDRETRTETEPKISASRPTKTYRSISTPKLIIIIVIIILGLKENLGVFSSTTLNFISELGRRICVHTGDARETSYLFQRISIMLQRFNSVLLHDTLPVDLSDLGPSDIFILAFFSFQPRVSLLPGVKNNNNNKRIRIAP